MVEKRVVLEEARAKRKKRRRIIWLSILGALVLFIVVYSLFSFTDLFIGSSEKTIESSPQQTDDWPMFRRDLARSGTDDPAVVSTKAALAGLVKWSFTTAEAIHSSPCVSDGVVYFGSRDRHLYAVDAVTGQQLWAVETDSWVESSPVVVGGVVYFGCNDAFLYAVDAKTGAEVWKHKTVHALRSSPAVANGVIYIGADNFRVYALDAATGEEKWSKPTGNIVISAPAVNKGIVVVGCSDGLLYTFNAGNGKARLEFDSGYNIIASPAIRDTTAYFADAQGVFYAMDISQKNWLWENKLKQYWNALYLYGAAPKPPAPSGLLWTLPLGFFINTASSCSLSGDYAYLGAGSNVVCVDLNAKKIAWTFATKQSVTSSPAVVGDVVYVGGQDGFVYALNKTTGEKLWQLDLGKTITSSPAVVNGVLYIGCDDGKMYAIE